jgi:hypothetical protein
MVLFCLFLVTALATLGAFALFRLTSNNSRRERLWRQLWANLFAIRLYADEPRLVLEGLLGVITANAGLLITALPALLIMSALGILLFGPLDRIFGVAPFDVSNPRVLTVRLKHLDGDWPDMRLETPDWITVDSPPVHVFNQREISWRIRANKPSVGVVKVIGGGDIVETKIDIRSWPACVQLSVSDVSMPAPEQTLSLLGISLNWVWWFSIFSILLAFPLHWLLSR